MTRRTVLAAAAVAILAAGCTQDSRQVTTSNLNAPPGGFGSFADLDEDDERRSSGRVGRGS